MKKLSICLIFTTLTYGKCLGDGTIPLYAFLNFASYQQGFGFSSSRIRPAFDVSTAWWLVNAGLNYQIYYGTNIYIGIGLSSFAQLQYGYALSLKKNMVRFRSDVPIGIFVEMGKLNNVFIGLFTEYTFDYKRKGTTLGITLSYVFPLDLDPVRRKK